MTSQTQQLPLADIHLQEMPPYFPLSVWGNLLIVALLLLLVVVLFLGYRYYQKNSVRRTALVTLSQINNNNELAKINALLKQVAMSYNGRSEVASLTGNAWFSYLDTCLAEKYQGFGVQEKLWLDVLYRGSELSNDEFKRCKIQARIWIKNATFESRQNEALSR